MEGLEEKSNNSSKGTKRIMQDTCKKPRNGYEHI